MSCSHSFTNLAILIVCLGVAMSARADTVDARCDVYPKGEDRAMSSGACTFSQRQGAVGIQLQNGQRYDLRPVGNQAGSYEDQDGKPAYRQSGLGKMGQIYRLAQVSIYVYWDPAPYTKPGSKPVPAPVSP